MEKNNKEIKEIKVIKVIKPICVELSEEITFTPPSIKKHSDFHHTQNFNNAYDTSNSAHEDRHVGKNLSTPPKHHA